MVDAAGTTGTSGVTVTVVVESGQVVELTSGTTGVEVTTTMVEVAGTTTVEVSGITGT
jgi:hypothetical protein